MHRLQAGRRQPDDRELSAVNKALDRRAGLAQIADRWLENARFVLREQSQ